MIAKEIVRMKRNEKVKCYADSVLKGCISNGFSVSDMKDLAEILPTEINKAIISLEKCTDFSIPSE